MVGINVLLDTFKGVNTSENLTTLKGKETPDGYENVAAVFAAILQGSMNLNSNPKGQNSQADQDSEETQSNAASQVQREQNLNGSGSNLGYGNFALPFFTQMMLQSDLPAGKDLEFALGNPVSLTSDEGLASTGMTTLNSQGNNLGITELDKYRQVITDLLVALSGAITESTLEGNLSGRENMGTKDFRQEFAQIGLQRLSEGLIVGSSKGDSDNSELNTKVASLMTALYPMSKEGGGDAKMPLGLKETLTSLKGMGIDLESMLNAAKDTGFHSINAEMKSKQTVLQENRFLKNFQDNLNEEVNKANPMKSVDLMGTKDGQSEPSSIGVGVVANGVPQTREDGKFVTVPVGEQITTVVREQIMSKQQALKELDIQLHPEDLGKIRIFLRWESGQVHLQVQASEAPTGQLLQNQLSELRQNLMSQGVNCGSLQMQMGQNGERQQQSYGYEAQRTFHQSNIHSDEDEEQISIINPISLGPDGINRINVEA